MTLLIAERGATARMIDGLPAQAGGPRFRFADRNPLTGSPRRLVWSDLPYLIWLVMGLLGRARRRT